MFATRAPNPPTDGDTPGRQTQPPPSPHTHTHLTAGQTEAPPQPTSDSHPPPPPTYTTHTPDKQTATTDRYRQTLLHQEKMSDILDILVIRSVTPAKTINQANVCVDINQLFPIILIIRTFLRTNLQNKIIQNIKI